MERKEPLQKPGNPIIRILVDFWYFFIISGYQVFRTWIKEIFHTIPKRNYTSTEGRTTEQVAVLTGATGGIGFEVLKKLLLLNFRVFVGVEYINEGKEIIEKMQSCEGISTGAVKCFHLDLKSFKSVKKFSQDVIGEAGRLDVLINCAGIANVPCGMTEDGVETTFQVNYLSHFLLTQLLLSKMEETAKFKKTSCRIVNISSLLHYAASGEDIKDSVCPNIYCGAKAYNESKLCLTLFAKYLDKTLQKRKSNVRVYSVHPGIVGGTNMWRFCGVTGILMGIFKRLFRSVEDAAEEILFVVTSPSLEHYGGAYIQNTRVAKASKYADNEELQKYLWNMSQNLIKNHI